MGSVTVTVTVTATATVAVGAYGINRDAQRIPFGSRGPASRGRSSPVFLTEKKGRVT